MQKTGTFCSAGRLCAAVLQSNRLLIMRTGVLLFTGILMTAQLLQAAPGFTQKPEQKEISLDYTQVAMRTVFEAIERQADVVIMYEQTPAWKKEKISISVKDKTVGEVLNQLLKNTAFTWSIRENVIRIQKGLPPPPPAHLYLQQSPPSVLAGRITDTTGKPLGGAALRIRRSGNALTVQADGNFVVNALPGDILEISYVGYTAREIAVTQAMLSSNTFLVIELKPTENMLKDVIVNKGYYTTTKRLNTGNVATVRAADIENQPVMNSLQALQGQVSGLFIQQTSGLPGAPVKVQLRGTNSITAGTLPLYIIDGVPFNGESVDKQMRGGFVANVQPNGGSDPLNLLNPQDIERIEVLKDADATAIYGSRGANGVVLITTRRGKPGKTALALNAYTGMGRLSRYLPTLNTQEYLNLRRKAFANDGITPTADNAPDLVEWSATDNTNYQKYLMGNTSHLTEVTASLSGGNNQTSFLLGSTFRHEGTVVPGNSRYRRGSVNMKVNHTSPDGRLKADLSTNFARDDNSILGRDFTSLAISMPNNYPLYTQSGSLYWGGGISNPLALLKERFQANTENLLMNGVLSYNILSNLQLKASVGYNTIQLDQKTMYPKASDNPANNPQASGFYTGNLTRRYLAEPLVDYNIRIGDGKLSATAGGTWQYTQFNQPYFVYAANFPSDDLIENYGAAGIIYVNKTYYQEYKYVSVFGRVNYAWKSRYIINSTFRRDGSSRFAPARRFANFGSAGAAWIFSDEAFVKPLAWLSSGKLRASYGTVGNDQISNYGYLNVYTPIPFTYGNNPSYYPLWLADPNYSWERSKKLEAALELGFFSNKLNVTAAWFRNRIGNLLTDYPLSAQTGFNSYIANMNALIQNQGVELDIKASPVENKVLSWNLSFNLSASRNKVLSFPNLLQSSYANTYAVGQPLNLMAGYHFTGFKNGVATVADVNNDGVISPGLAANGQGDYIVAGSKDPKFYGGFSSTLRYRQWQLDLLCNFVKQENYAITSFPGLLTNQYNNVLSSGFTPGTLSSSASYGSYSNYYVNSDAVITDASFIRLKNLSLSYTLPDKWRQAVKMSSCRIYLRAQNLFTITRFMGLDPELPFPSQPGSTANVPSMPTLRMLTAGFQCAF